MDGPRARPQQRRPEFAAGEAQLLEIGRHGESVRDQLLRIEGAIRVLEEKLTDATEFAAATTS